MRTPADALLSSGRGRPPLSVVRGEGARVYDEHDRAYVDFSAANGFAPLGHAHPRWRAAVHEQADSLAAADGAVATPARARLAARLASALPIADARVLLCDSGGEAVELATALGRAYGRASGRTKVVAFDGATVAPGADVVRVPRGDLASMDAALDGSVAAVLVDAVAVHDGVRPLDAPYLREVRRMTRERGCALLADEVVGGVGRCGDWLAISAAGVVPDAAALGSGLGGGIAIGAVVASDALSESVGELRPTAAGSPVACAAAVAVVDAIVDEQLLDNAVEQGDRLRAELQAMAERSALVGKVRGRGVLLGISLRRHAAHEFVLSLLAEGVLTTEVAPDEIVMSPPLVVGPDDIDAAIGAVASVLDSLDVGARA